MAEPDRTLARPPFAALCPVCGEPAASSVVNSNGLVTTGDYLCAGQHLWRTTWPAVA